MNLPFLRHLSSLGRRPLHRVVVENAAATTGAEATLQYLLAELPELLLAAVVAVESGQVLAGYASQPHLWPALAAPSWAATVRQLQASQAAQQPAAEQPAEILTTLLTQLHLLRLHPASRHFLYLAVDAHDTNLALAREVMRQAIDFLIVT